MDQLGKEEHRYMHQFIFSFIFFSPLPPQTTQPLQLMDKDSLLSRRPSYPIHARYKTTDDLSNIYYNELDNFLLHCGTLIQRSTLNNAF